MNRCAALTALFSLLFLVGCSGSGTIPAGSPAGDLFVDSESGVAFDCAVLEEDIEASCGDDVTDLGGSLEGTLAHILCSRTFSMGDPNVHPVVEVFLRTHRNAAAQGLAWQAEEGARDVTVGDGGYSYTQDLAYSDIDYLIVHEGLVTLQLKSVEWTRGTKPPAICTPEELEELASVIIARI